MFEKNTPSYFLIFPTLKKFLFFCQKTSLSRHFQEIIFDTHSAANLPHSATILIKLKFSKKNRSIYFFKKTILSAASKRVNGIIHLLKHKFPNRAEQTGHNRALSDKKREFWPQWLENFTNDPFFVWAWLNKSCLISRIQTAFFRFLHAKSLNIILF